jgi:phage tail-like protein
MNYYPPVGFYFKVEFSGIEGAGPKTVDTNFQEVSGLTAELEVEKFQEGGVNDYQHPLPKPAKYPNLSLKRGLLVDTKLVDWITNALDQFIIEPVNITVSLLNPKGEPLLSWEFTNAWPLKWDISGFNATDNALVVETIELTYQKFRRIKGNAN